ncbi:hypothetical protein AB0G05_19605 [Nonomuraea wenchangensis]
MSESPLCAAPRCGGQGGPRQAEPGQLICAACTNRLRRDIEITPTLDRWLGHHIAPGSGGGVKVSGSREAPVPIRLEVIDHAAHVRHVLQSWAWLIAEHRGLVYPERVTVEELASWLGRHVGWVAGQGWIADMCDELAGLRRTAHALAPWQVHVQQLVGPCLNCELRALIRVAGETYIECDLRVGGCGYLWSTSEYDGRVAELVEVETARTNMLTMTRRHPGRLPPAEQREKAESALREATERYEAARRAAQEAYDRAMAEPTAAWHEAIRAAAASPEGVPAADKKSLVTRATISQITGLRFQRIQEIVNTPAEP